MPLPDFVSRLTTSTGVYQMINADNEIIYIGKALNLKKRVSSYFQKNYSDLRLNSLVKQIDHINVIVTQNENEAFLLENQLIKQFQPKYNILLRDDKSYPYIVISSHEYPRLSIQRGSERSQQSKDKKKSKVFGPYPSITAVKEMVKLMQKIFKLRICRDSFFSHRTRPCLLYQIHKCTAPCVGYITKENYLEDVRFSSLLLQGKNQEVIDNIISKMQAASKMHDYELAAKYRDSVSFIRHIQTQQAAITEKKYNADVFALVAIASNVAIELLNIREGRIIGNHIFQLKVYLENEPSHILSSFIAQYYLSRQEIIDNIDEILVSHRCENHEFLEKMLKRKIILPTKTHKLQWIKIAQKTAEEVMKAALTKKQSFQDKLIELQKTLQLPDSIKRIACFDISHHGGESSIASCIVLGNEGFEKNHYRKFNIKNIQPGDDYGAMSQALERYFELSDQTPNILLIDGGKGQLSVAMKVVKKYHLQSITVLAIAKGVARKPGLEKIFLSYTAKPLEINQQSSAFHLLQQIRDEAHRFAITGHRKKQSRKRKTSFLENIAGIGPKKRKALLEHLGGLQQIKKANVSQLTRVPGIHLSLANKIYQFFHE